MLCKDCNLKAAYRCCTNILLCGPHFAQHFLIRKNHEPQQLAFRFDPKDQPLLKARLQTRILTLIQLQDQIVSYTKSLIRQIESLQSIILKEINEKIQNYREMLSSEEFYYINETTNILEFEMVVKEISLKDLQSKIDELFPKDLISFHNDSEKKMNLMRNKFLLTHNGGFLCEAISNDGKILVTGSQDTTVRVWDILARKQISCYVHHTGDVKCVIISSDSTVAFSGSSDRTLICGI